MLDDLQRIHERDAQDALGIAAKPWLQLSLDFPAPGNVRPVDNVVVSGMGGSAQSAYVAQSWPGLVVPFILSRDYDIPSFVGEKTLFIASSYSGNTEETVSALEKAENTGAAIVVVTTGGRLREVAAAKGYPVLQLPEGYRPRFAMLAALKALTVIFDAYGLTQGAAAELAAQDGWLQGEIAQWTAAVPTKDNWAKQIALECMGKSVVIYSGLKLAPAAYAWKTSFNENAKQIAWWNTYSEFDHNEFMGWTEQPDQKPYAVIDIRSNFEHPQVQKRFEASARLLSGRRPEPIVIPPRGETLLQQLLSTIVLGEFVTIYTALLANINPTPIDLIERLKNELG